MPTEQAVPAPKPWSPPTSWEIIRAAEETGLEGLSAPFLSDGDRQITEAGAALVKAARRVMVLYCREAQRHDKAAGGPYAND